MNHGSEAKSKMSIILDELFSIIETVLMTLFIISMVFTFLLKIVTVKGSSMKDTLMPEDKLVTTAWCSSPEQGDIIIVDASTALFIEKDGSLVYKTGLGKNIVKRVIAIEGQTVDIDFERGAVYVDGIMLDEAYVTGLTHLDEGAFTGQYPVTVPKDCVFVLGDNRAVSKDSRSDEIGFIENDNIIGKVIFRLSPFEELGFVE